jgi:hypothetical protein
MQKLIVDLTYLMTNHNCSKEEGVYFTVTREDLGTFDVKEKTYSKPGKRISKDEINKLTPVASVQQRIFGDSCIWHKVLVPTKMLDEPGKLEDVTSQLLNKSNSELERLNTSIRRMTSGDQSGPTGP